MQHRHFVTLFLSHLVNHSFNKYLLSRDCTRPALNVEDAAVNALPSQGRKDSYTSECWGSRGWYRSTWWWPCFEDQQVSLLFFLDRGPPLHPTPPPSSLIPTYISTTSSLPPVSPFPIHPPHCGHSHHPLMQIRSCLSFSNFQMLLTIWIKLKLFCMFLSPLIPADFSGLMSCPSQELKPHTSHYSHRELILVLTCLYLPRKSFSSPCPCSRFSSHQTP